MRTPAFIPWGHGRPVAAESIPARGGRGQRSLRVFLLGGAGALGTALFAGDPLDLGRWAPCRQVGDPRGRGRFIAVGSDATERTLRVLGEELRDESRNLENAVVMAFDDRTWCTRARPAS